MAGLHNTGQLRGIRSRWRTLAPVDVLQSNAGKPIMSETSNSIHFSQPRDTVEARLPDGRTICGPRGAPVGELPQPAGWRAAADRGGNRQRRAARADVLPADGFEGPAGDDGRCGRHAHLSPLADLPAGSGFHHALPRRRCDVDHSVSSGGYYLPGDRSAAAHRGRAFRWRRRCNGWWRPTCPSAAWRCRWRRRWHTSAEGKGR